MKMRETASERERIDAAALTLASRFLSLGRSIFFLLFSFLAFCLRAGGRVEGAPLPVRVRIDAFSLAFRG